MSRISTLISKLKESTADTILQQLGGNKFIVMTGAKNLLSDKDKLQFKIGKNNKGITHVEIILNSKDLYDLKFYKIRGTNITIVKEITDVPAENLQSTFTDITGLDTHL